MTGERIWYLWTREGQKGPYTAVELRAWKDSGNITDEWHVWRDGFSAWRKIGETPELFIVLPQKEETLSSFQLLPGEEPRGEPAEKPSKNYLQIFVSLCVVLILAILFKVALGKFRYDRKQESIKAQQEKEEPLLKYIDKMPSISNQYLQKESAPEIQPKPGNHLYKQLQNQIPPQTQLEPQK